MATRIVPIQCLVAVAALVLTGNGVIDPADGRLTPRRRRIRRGGSEGTARTIEHVRTLVAELEAQAERQRSELRMTEATLGRGRICWPNSKAAGGAARRTAPNGPRLFRPKNGEASQNKPPPRRSNGRGPTTGRTI